MVGELPSVLAHPAHLMIKFLLVEDDVLGGRAQLRLPRPPYQEERIFPRPFGEREG